MASQVNGPVGMYKLKPYYDPSIHVELPNNMYKLQTYYEANDSGVKGGPEDALAVLEKRQEAILKRLDELKSQVTEMVQTAGVTVHGQSTTAQAPNLQGTDSALRDIVICAHPDNIPLSILVMTSLLAQEYKVLKVCHVHSSAIGVPEKLRNVFGTNNITPDRNAYQLALTIIWKEVKYGPTLMVSPNVQTTVLGETSIARYLARLLNPAYDSGDITTATEIDTMVDMAGQILNGNNKEKAAVLRTLNSKLGKSHWLVGSELSLADIVLWSAINQSKLAEGAQENVKKWIKRCNEAPAFQSALEFL